MKQKYLQMKLAIVEKEIDKLEAKEKQYFCQFKRTKEKAVGNNRTIRSNGGD